MLHTNRFLGGILLIAGTSVGAGMLAIPVISCFCGFYPSFIVMSLCYLFMLLTAFLFLEVNLFFPGEVNMVTMATKTLGQFGKVLSWVAYLLLLYFLTSAYISGSSPIFRHILSVIFNIDMPSWVGPLPLLIIFGIFIYLGTKPVDYVNRILMTGLIFGYVMLVFFVPEHVSMSFISHFDMKPVLLCISVMITSFGYHIIIPSLTSYMRHNVKKLRLMIFIGSTIPFIIYGIWQFLILGSVPLYGEDGLINAWRQGIPATIPLMKVLQNRWVAIGAQLFSFFAIITSFLGVSLSLSDFLRDGLKIKNTSGGRLLACLLTFIPPLIFVYSYQKAFFLGLQYAGVFVAILLAMLPALMVWVLPKKEGFFHSFFGRVVLSIVILISFFIIIVDIIQKFDLLDPLISKYLS